jgi:hypothetical protein
VVWSARVVLEFGRNAYCVGESMLLRYVTTTKDESFNLPLPTPTATTTTDLPTVAQYGANHINTRSCSPTHPCSLSQPYPLVLCPGLSLSSQRTRPLFPHLNTARTHTSPRRPRDAHLRQPCCRAGSGGRQPAHVWCKVSIALRSSPIVSCGLYGIRSTTHTTEHVLCSTALDGTPSTIAERAGSGCVQALH